MGDGTSLFLGTALLTFFKNSNGGSFCKAGILGFNVNIICFGENMITIRAEQPNDIDAIRAIHGAASEQALHICRVVG